MENALEAAGEIKEGNGFINLDISYVKEVFQLGIRSELSEKRKRIISVTYLTTKDGITSTTVLVFHL